MDTNTEWGNRYHERLLVQHAEAIAGQLRDYPLVRPNGGWPLLAGTARLGLTPAEGPARLFERGRVAATPVAGRGSAGQHYLRLMFAAAF